MTTKIFALTSDICIATLSKEISEVSPSLTCSDSEKTQLVTETSELETAVAAIAKDLTDALQEMEGKPYKLSKLLNLIFCSPGGVNSSRRDVK